MWHTVKSSVALHWAHVGAGSTAVHLRQLVLNFETLVGTLISDAICNRFSSERSSPIHVRLGRLVTRNNHTGSFLVGRPLLTVLVGPDSDIVCRRYSVVFINRNIIVTFILHKIGHEGVADIRANVTLPTCDNLTTLVVWFEAQLVPGGTHMAHAPKWSVGEASWCEGRIPRATLVTLVPSPRKHLAAPHGKVVQSAVRLPLKESSLVLWVFASWKIKRSGIQLIWMTGFLQNSSQ